MVDFDDCIAYDFDGAGFVAEDGNEGGSYTNNFSVCHKGNGEFQDRITFFNNIAADCKGAAFHYWPYGKIDPLAKSGSTDPYAINDYFPQYSTMPLDRIPPNTDPRYWDWNEDGINDGAILTDIRAKEFNNNNSYACHTGLKIRFLVHPSNSLFGREGGGADPDNTETPYPGINLEEYLVRANGVNNGTGAGRIRPIFDGILGFRTQEWLSEELHDWAGESFPEAVAWVNENGFNSLTSRMISRQLAIGAAKAGDMGQLDRWMLQTTEPRQRYYAVAEPASGLQLKHPERATDWLESLSEQN